MDHAKKVDLLMARANDDARRLALDAIDDEARAGHTWGSKEHRDARERVERVWDEARRKLDALSEEKLDEELAKGG